MIDRDQDQGIRDRVRAQVSTQTAQLVKIATLRWRVKQPQLTEPHTYTKAVRMLYVMRLDAIEVLTALEQRAILYLALTNDWAISVDSTIRDLLIEVPSFALNPPVSRNRVPKPPVSRNRPF